jgi:hypothetical protein
MPQNHFRMESKIAELFDNKRNGSRPEPNSALIPLRNIGPDDIEQKSITKNSNNKKSVGRNLSLTESGRASFMRRFTPRTE